MTDFHAVASGKAIVCCPHDRIKREITTEAQVAELGLAVGQIYNPHQHRLWTCSCCQNLFVHPSDEPRHCTTCTVGPLKHQLNGNLPTPNGRPH